jgi:hypothetical protein
LFDVLSGTLGQVGGVVTNTVYNQIHDLTDKNKSVGEKLYDFLLKDGIGGSLVQGAMNGGKEQWKDWTDGKWSWGDVPGVGLLHGMDKGWKRGEDIMGEAGVTNPIGKIGGGIGLDIALDPLTYFTGGLSAAGKLSKVAELEKVAELSKGLGITNKFKSGEDFLSHITDTMKSNLIRKNPNVAESVIDKTVAKHVGELADQIKTAKNTTFNAHVNDWGFSAPFSKKFLKVGEYGKKNLLHRSEETVSKHLVDDLLHKASFGSKELKPLLEQAVHARYGVGHTGELSKTMFDDLHTFVDPIIKQMEKRGLPDVTVVQKVVDHVLPHEDFTKLMDEFKSQNIPWKDVKGQLDEILKQTAHDPQLRSSFGSHLASMVEDYWKGKGGKNFSKVANDRKAESMNWASRFLHGSDKYQTVETKVKDVFKHGSPENNAVKDTRVFNKQFGKMVDSKYNEMGNFKTNFEHFLGKHNIFDSRTLATGDKFVNSMGEHISDAHSQRIGETARYSRGMDKVQNFLKKYTGNIDKKDLMNQAIYLLENHAPDALGGKDWLANAPKDVKDLANLMKPILDRIGSEEHGAGVIDNLRNNYFPHVVNHNDKTLSDMQDFLKRHKELNGNSGKSVFNKERTSFQTMAQKDNYLAKIEKAIQKESDPATIESLRKQHDRVAEMFDTNVVSALQRRIKTGVRAKAMKDLQGKLSKYGMMKTLPKMEKGSKDVHVPEGLTELSADEAKKLGLGAGRHFIHPDVLKGMKRVDEIFTAEGMNKFTRHINALADVWRPLVTFYKPSHYLNNMFGNVVNNLAAGVRVQDYKVAGKLLKGYREGTLTSSEMKIIDNAYKHNVISGGYLYDSHQTFKFDDPTKLEKLAKHVGDNKIIKNVRHYAGEKADDVSRLANYVNGMRKYGKSEMAAKQVREYLFNYNELTNADRTLRTIVPFWNWTKRNVPLQMKLLMENPKYALTMERAKHAFNENQPGADWQKDSGAKIPGMNYYKSIPSPTNDLSMLYNPGQLLGSLTPALKMPLEMYMNKKMFTNKPISYGSDSLQPQDILPYLMSNLGVGGNIYDAASGRKGILESLANLFLPVSKISKANGGD